MDFVSQTAEPLRRRGVVDEERVIPASDTLLKATLNVPLGAQGIVALLHAASGDRFGVQDRFASEADSVGELRAPTLLIVGREEQARAAELAAEFFARRLRGSLPCP